MGEHASIHRNLAPHNFQIEKIEVFSKLVGGGNEKATEVLGREKGTCQASGVYLAQNMGGEKFLDPQRRDKKSSVQSFLIICEKKMDALEVQDQAKNSL